MRESAGWRSAASVLIATPLLLWPALVNGYPLLFGDTGVYVYDGIARHVSWPRPMFYGLFMLPLHLKLTTWPVVVAQAVIASAVLLVTLRSFVPRSSAWLLLPVTLALSIGTSLPWLVSQLMPDLFAGLLLLTLACLLLAPRLRLVCQVLAVGFAAVCITMHLSLMPISLAVIVSLLAYRLFQRRRLGFPVVARAVAVPAIAACVLIGINALLIGQASFSPYGKIFLLNRVLADGPGVRALERECPRPGWTLCEFKAELPRIVDEDDILWGSDSVLSRAGGYKVVAPQVWPIVLSAGRAEPGTLLWQAARNTARQFISFRSGDGLLRSPRFNDGVWRDEFPPAEQERYHAGRQYRGLELVPGWLQAVHVTVAAVSMVGVAVGFVAGVRRRDRLAGLLGAILVALAANAFVSGALSGVFDRYQSRFVWVAAFGLLAWLIDARLRRVDAPG